MTKFLEKSFSTYAPADEQYRKNFDAIFGGEKEEDETKPDLSIPHARTCPFPKAHCDCIGYKATPLLVEEIEAAKAAKK